jgi:light-regulated signal transduction histidine kinase (bacteriophytochrome)
MRYDKQNKKLSDLQAEIAVLKRENAAVKEDAKRITEILDSALHEVRRFSAQLSKFSEKLSRDTKNNAELNLTAQSIFYTAGMISSRLAYTDIELNPRALESQTAIKSGIYKKFDKAKRILSEEAREKNLSVKLVGESRTEILALPVFELLPFVLIENAIKYSPKSQDITISFDSFAGRQSVVINSIGPALEKDEFRTLFGKGTRGKSANKISGQGLGLYLAKKVCEYHDIDIVAEPGKENLYEVNGVRNSEFRIVLSFNQ